MAWIKVGYFDEWSSAQDWKQIAFVSDGPGRRSLDQTRCRPTAMGP
jgi:hypothetical protein